MAPSFADLVHMDLRSLAAWLQSEVGAADLGQQERRGLVGLYASRMVDAAEQITSEEWSDFTDALDRAMVSAGLDRTERAIRRLNLMVALIAAVGPSAEHSLRNPNAAVTIFLDALPMEFDEASTLVVDWRQASREDIRRLRSIKNLLRPLIAAVGSVSAVEHGEAVGKWMTLLVQLP